MFGLDIGGLLDGFRVYGGSEVPGGSSTSDCSESCHCHGVGVEEPPVLQQ